eukprot:TRINITY_DN41241_c0_g1_i1.p1 TRINITY_DN41241_c0_g1~~TRINITY_DN41241_c0_g1_i1.p1  ORF type:complete len:548 (-),score=85.68 TRINITY_DN41241_c0_g1_i1:478-2121(-)
MDQSAVSTVKMVCKESDGVTVVTVTRNRPELLVRLADSIAAQLPADLYIKHIVLGDECPQLEGGSKTQISMKFRSVACREQHVENCLRSTESRLLTASARCSRLRMYAVRNLVKTEWVAFLDDDVVLQSHHLSSLIACATTAPQVSLVHSHRVLFEPGGAGFAGDYFPWAVNDTLSKSGLEVMQRRGIIAEGCPVVFDIDTWDELTGYSGTVDTNEWLMRHSLLLRIPWAADVSVAEEASGIYEDGKFLRSIRDAQEPLRCTHLPSLGCQLGGRTTKQMQTAWQDTAKPSDTLGLLRQYAARAAMVDRLASLAADRKQGRPLHVVLILRHGIRHPIPRNPTKAEIAESRLTPAGILEAEHLGKALAVRGLGINSASAKWRQLLSSPVARCVHTVESLAKGAGLNSKMEVIPMKALQGLKESNSVAAWQEVQSVGFKVGDIVDRLGQGHRVPGFVPLAEYILWLRASCNIGQDGTQEEEERTNEMKRQNLELTVACTHDIVLASLVQHFLPSPENKTPWPEFLEGALWWEASDGSQHFFFNSEETILD